MSKEKINVTFKVDVEDIIEAFNSLTDISDKKKAKIAIDLGENGDLTYELFLLYGLSKLIPRIYSPDVVSENEDPLVHKISEKLLEIKPLLKEILKKEK